MYQLVLKLINDNINDLQSAEKNAKTFNKDNNAEGVQATACYAESLHSAVQSAIADYRKEFEISVNKLLEQKINLLFLFFFLLIFFKICFYC